MIVNFDSIEILTRLFYELSNVFFFLLFFLFMLSAVVYEMNVICVRRRNPRAPGEPSRFARPSPLLRRLRRRACRCPTVRYYLRHSPTSPSIGRSRRRCRASALRRTNIGRSRRRSPTPVRRRTRVRINLRRSSRCHDGRRMRRVRRRCEPATRSSHLRRHRRRRRVG